jgi:hypothetical protein
MVCQTIALNLPRRGSKQKLDAFLIPMNPHELGFHFGLSVISHPDSILIVRSKLPSLPAGEIRIGSNKVSTSQTL